MSNSKNVRKKTIVTKIARQLYCPYEQTSSIIESFIKEMKTELSKGNRLEFRKFGVFEPVTRKSRIARNPKTKVEVMIPERKAVRFKMGSTIKKQLNVKGFLHEQS